MVRHSRLTIVSFFSSNKLNYIKGASTADLIVELQARGIDLSSAIEQMQAKREKKAEVIEFPSLA